MNSIKKYGLELIIVAMFLVINTFIIVYFNGEIKAEQRLAQKSNSVTDVAKNVDNSENKEDNSETSSADTKTSEAEVKTEENTDAETSVVKEPEKKLEEPKVKPQPKKKKKAKKDKYYEVIEEYYNLLKSQKLDKDEMYSIIDYLNNEIPKNYKLRYYRGLSESKKENHTMDQVMINEILARNGKKFKSELKNFYKKQSWYEISSDEDPFKIIEKNDILNKNFKMLTNIRDENKR